MVKKHAMILDQLLKIQVLAFYLILCNFVLKGLHRRGKIVDDN